MRKYINNLSVIGLIITFIIIIEVGLEYRAYSKGWNTLLFGMKVREIVSNQQKKSPHYGPTNKFPFRSKIIANKKPNGAVRIWVSSSSYGEDIYVAADKIFPNLIGGATTLKVFETIQVLNASKAGLTVKSNTLELKKNGEIWLPDIVILYQMSNDISQLSAGNFSKNNVDLVEEDDLSAEIEKHRPNYLIRIVERLTFYRNLKSLVTPMLNQAKFLSDSIDADANDEFKRRVEEFVIEAKNNGAEVVLCTFAISHDGRYLNDPPAAIMNSVLKFNEKLSYKGWVNTVKSFNDIIRKTAEKHNVILVDLYKEVTGKREYFRDFFHFTKKGHKKVAELISSNKKFILLLGKQDEF